MWATDHVDEYEFDAERCNVTDAHRTLVCPATPAGPVGVDIAWTVKVGGQQSTTPTTSVAAPVVASLHASRPRLRTAGGDAFTLRGEHFGVRDDRLDHVTCGFGDAALVARECTVVEPNVAVRCVAPPGLGVELPCRIGVGGQTSDAASRKALLRYAAPRIDALQPPMGVPTEGGELEIEGAEFATECVSHARARSRRPLSRLPRAATGA